MWVFSVLQKHGTRDFALTMFRHFAIKGPVGCFIVWNFWGFVAYVSGWNTNIPFHNFGPVQKWVPAECLPEDKKIVARMYDTYPIRYDRCVALKAGGKEFPLGTRYDWLSGEPVLPNDPNYHWIDGRPIRKDRKYFHPGPEG